MTLANLVNRYDNDSNTYANNGKLLLSMECKSMTIDTVFKGNVYLGGGKWDDHNHSVDRSTWFNMIGARW